MDDSLLPTATSASATDSDVALEGTNPAGITNIRFKTRPTFAKVDIGGDLDLFIGEYNKGKIL